MKLYKDVQIRRKLRWPICLALALLAASLTAAWLARPAPTAKNSPSAGLTQSGLPSAAGVAPQNRGITKAPSAVASRAGSEPLASAAGSIAYVDPLTGQFGEPPPGAFASLVPSGDDFSTSDEGLVETKSPTPGGGMMIDLQGRFQNAMTLSSTPGGQLSSMCTTAAAVDGAANANGAGTAKTANQP